MKGEKGKATQTTSGNRRLSKSQAAVSSQIPSAKPSDVRKTRGTFHTKYCSSHSCENEVTQGVHFLWRARVPEGLMLEAPLEVIQPNPRWSKAWALKISKDGDSTTLLGKMILGLTPFSWAETQLHISPCAWWLLAIPEHH